MVVSPALKSQLEELARHRRRSVSQLVAFLLEAALDADLAASR
jgi:hypothetical protein